MARLVVILVLLTALTAIPAAAAEECFQIIAPIAPASTVGAPAAVAAIKLNRCTGETWVLSLLNIPGKPGGNTWRWTPINNEDHEAVWQH
jgi:hypothetical protein